MDTLEAFLARYPSTIALLSAVGTIAAVVVALYLAGRQSRPRLKVFVDIRLYFSSEAQQGRDTLDTRNAPSVIMVSIDNIGPVPVTIPYLSSFVWSVPFGKEVMQQNPHEPVFRNQPIKLEPGRSAALVLTNDLEAYRVMLGNLARKSRVPWLAARYPRLTVSTEVGHRFRATFGRTLKRLHPKEG
ncbi:hypothetical protein [Ferrovibrio sp.]|uniref:hypothetical protein n=1 Tax=Ferrovibrio sp. TaxID=1917215 RepID=UPI00311FF148